MGELFEPHAGQVVRAVPSVDQAVETLRHRRYAARPGAPERAQALSRLQQALTEANRNLVRYQQLERAGQLRGLRVVDLERELELARQLLVGGAPTRDLSAAETEQLRVLAARVHAVETQAQAVGVALDRYGQARRRGQTAGYVSVEAEALARRSTAEIAPLVQRLQQSRQALVPVLQSWGTRHTGWPTAERERATALLARGRTAERQADAHRATWLGFDASRFDTLNQGDWARWDRQASSLALRTEHGGRDYASGRHPVPWYYWAIGGVALLGVVYVGGRVGLGLLKRTPHYRIASALVGGGLQRNPGRPARALPPPRAPWVSLKRISAGLYAVVVEGQVAGTLVREAGAWVAHLPTALPTGDRAVLGRTLSEAKAALVASLVPASQVQRGR